MNKDLLVLFIVVILALTSQRAQSDVIWFRDITFDKGLPFNKACFTISQDHKGFIWFGSESGLHRYDGNDFKTYVHDKDDINSIPEGKVYATFFDSQNNFWVTTGTGVCRYIEDENRFLHVPLVYEPFGEFNEPVLGLYENANKEIFLHCHFSLYRYNPDKVQFERIISNFKEIDQASFVFESIIEKDGYFICGTNAKGLVVFNIEKNKIEWYGSQYVGATRVSKVFKSKNGQVWFATDQGVSVISSVDQLLNGQNKGFQIVPKTKGILFNGISEDDEGNIWAASDGDGIFKIDHSTLEVKKYQYNENDNKSILSNKTALIYVDRQNNLWAFFNNYGFNVSNLNFDPFFQTYTSNNKHGNCLSGDIVTSFAQDKKGNIWIGTDGDGLNYFDVENERFEHFFSTKVGSRNLSSNVILSLYIDSFEKLWIGTYQGGLSCYDPESKKFTTFMNNESAKNEISGNDITSIVEDNDGNLFVLTNSNGLNILNRETGRFVEIKNDINDIKKLSHNGGTSLFKDHEGNIWIGTYYGLNRMDAKTKDIIKYFNSPTDSLSISSNVIDCIFEDSQHRIWVGTGKGLNLMVDPSGKFKRFTVDDGLPNNQVNSLIEDDYGFLWVGTNRGLSRLNLHTFDFKNFGKNYNLPGYVMVARSAIKSNDKKLYFGGTRGFTSFNPIQKYSVSMLPPLHFTEFKIFDKTIIPNEKINGQIILDKDISNTESVSIRHIHKSFSFTFSSLDYANIAKVDYFYMLEGFDEEWRTIVNPNRTINYTNLSPGKYTLKVKASLADEFNESDIVEMKIIILSPWWRTWWAYLLYLILFFATLQTIIYVALNKVKLSRKLLDEKNKKEKEIEIGRIKDNFYTSITHEFKTPLTLVLGPLEVISKKYNKDNYLNGQIGLIKKNATRLLLLINELLDFRKYEAGTMQLRICEVDFSDFFFQIAQSFTSYSQIHKINFNVENVDNDIKLWFDKNKLEKVFFNLLSNAFKYTPDNGEIHCKIELLDKEQVCIQIKDSGIGIPKNEIDNVFNKYYSAKNSMGYESTGLGLYLTKEIVELHHGNITVKNNDDVGVCFEVRLLLGNEHFESMDFADQTHVDIITEPFFLIPEDEPDEMSIDASQLGNNNVAKEKQIILIVEDNDDVRTFVKSELLEKYNVFEAINGKQGLEMAKDIIPDLIISDIMMPEMDGRSLCNLLKNDVLTSHIPIILLTALSDIENRISGLEMGADSYITKPFHPKHLSVRIEKLLDLRRTLQEKYSINIDRGKSTIVYAPGEVDKLSADELFIQRLVKAIEENLSDSNYQIDDLCKDVGMNYLQLYRKVKAITDMSIKQFINTIKMRNAARMLELGKFNISEVAYDVGFSSPAYFSETFKKHFSLTPSEYIKKMS